jgi:hypothetical protein
MKQPHAPGSARPSLSARQGLLLAAMLSVAPLAHAATQVVAEVADMKAAENSIQASTGRIFVSSNGSMFELTTQGSTWSKVEITTQFANNKARPCYYLGLTEYAKTLYTVCTEDSQNATAPKYLLALDLATTGAPLREIAPLQAQGLPNGLASDGAGNLYFSNLATLAPGNIWRITLANRFQVASQKMAYQFAALNPNGMKYYGGKLYVTANPPALVGTSELQRFPVSSTGLGTPTTVYSATSFLDDFGLVKGGFLLANYLGTAVLHLSESGQLLHSAAAILPTSATYVKNSALPNGGVVVTLGGSSKAVIATTDWGLSAR